MAWEHIRNEHLVEALVSLIRDSMLCRKVQHTAQHQSPQQPYNDKKSHGDTAMLARLTHSSVRQALPSLWSGGPHDEDDDNDDDDDEALNGGLSNRPSHETEQQCLSLALSVLWTLTSNDSITSARTMFDSIVGCGCVGWLSDLLWDSSAKPEQSVAAINVLLLLSDEPKNLDAIRRSGVIPRLASLMGGTAVVSLHEPACVLLSR